MIDATHALPISRQAQLAGISRGSVYEAETEETMLLLREYYRHHNEKLFSEIGVKYDWNERVGLK